MKNSDRLKLLGGLTCVRLAIDDLERAVMTSDWDSVAVNFRSASLDLESFLADFNALPKTASEKYSGTCDLEDEP